MTTEHAVVPLEPQAYVVTGDADEVARQFHEAYERLAPEFGYETRPESAVPWEDVPEPNRWLMAAAVRAVLDQATPVFDADDDANQDVPGEIVRVWVEVA